MVLAVPASAVAPASLAPASTSDMFSSVPLPPAPPKAPTLGIGQMSGSPAAPPAAIVPLGAESEQAGKARRPRANGSRELSDFLFSIDMETPDGFLQQKSQADSDEGALNLKRTVSGRRTRARLGDRMTEMDGAVE